MKESYSVKPAKIKAMAETAKSMAKLLQLFFARLGFSPETPIARNADLPDGLTLHELIYWLGVAIEKAEDKAEEVLPADIACTYLNRWGIK